MRTNRLFAEIHDARAVAAVARAKVIPLCRLKDTLFGGRRPAILTKGTFDIIHRGHLHLMAFCAALKRKYKNGVFVVAVERDEAVRRRKGPTRPVNNERIRAEQMAALSVVDYVVLMGNRGLVDLIRQLRPVVFVKGQDTALTERPSGRRKVALVASERNPEVPTLLQQGSRLIVFVDDGRVSTSELIKRIRQLPD